jgi:hypothetical protein
MPTYLPPVASPLSALASRATPPAAARPKTTGPVKDIGDFIDLQQDKLWL